MVVPYLDHEPERAKRDRPELGPWNGADNVAHYVKVRFQRPNDGYEAAKKPARVALRCVGAVELLYDGNNFSCGTVFEGLPVLCPQRPEMFLEGFIKKWVSWSATRGSWHVDLAVVRRTPICHQLISWFTFGARLHVYRAVHVTCQGEGYCCTSSGLEVVFFQGSIGNMVGTSLRFCALHQQLNSCEGPEGNRRGLAYQKA